ncbi:ATP synthase F1 subunit gamma [Candidatus Peregrinibacteria bacterium]|jgi:F-type H+-transporting ATPase subunit gamma|nr:ATP synthase F1 subunit gamma [Candidatus Peregrinibacteria bacterium]MBT4055520.1 ATP synthase F1 subunit gamma [Candidatus Peregrinibacteria bacterium]
MAGSEKDIKRKIKSINSTHQITKAMELVATSKMKKAVDGAVSLRSYGYLAFQIMAKLSKKATKLHAYFQEREVKNVLVVLFTTDKGLCGGLNTNIAKKFVTLEKQLEEKHKNAKLHFVASGKKGAEFLHRIGKEVDMVFPAFSNNPSFEDILPVAKIALKGFEKGDYDKVVLVYPDFVSTLVQNPVAKTLLPFSLETFEEMMEELGSKFTDVAKPQEKDLDYKLEPSPKYILDNIVPQLTEVQLYQAVLEATASEHSARMVAMQNATKAANDILDDLVLTYNQARQASITAEIAEISSSMAVIA